MHWIDPAALPTVKGQVSQYTINTRGEVDGVLLEGLQQIHVPPHLGPALERLVAVGAFIEARYVKPRDAAVFAAVSVRNAAGEVLLDEGPAKVHREHRGSPASKPVRVASVVRQTLFAPKGEVCGALLDDGTQVRFAPKENADLADCFRVGTALEVWGSAFSRKGIRVVDLHEVAVTEAG